MHSFSYMIVLMVKVAKLNFEKKKKKKKKKKKLGSCCFQSCLYFHFEL